MSESFPLTSSIIDHPSHILLIVVGSHLRAEVADRPLAYRMQKAILDWIEVHHDRLTHPIEPIVCSDVWYLNDKDLQKRPTISIGGPGVNAFAAYYARMLSEDAKPDEKQVVIQIDPEFTDLHVSIWGTDHDLTEKGMALFMDDYLDRFMRAVATQVEPEVE